MGGGKKNYIFALLPLAFWMNGDIVLFSVVLWKIQSGDMICAVLLPGADLRSSALWLTIHIWKIFLPNVVVFLHRVWEITFCTPKFTCHLQVVTVFKLKAAPFFHMEIQGRWFKGFFSLGTSGQISCCKGYVIPANNGKMGTLPMSPW